MNTTNSPASDLAIQQLAAHAGYNISGLEIALAMSVAGAVVHILHQAVAGWGAMGGFAGIRQYFMKGNKP